nr:amidase family protein [Xanthomonadales bacterium]
ALISFNREHAEQVMPHFGQDILIASQAKGDLRSPEYIHARKESLRLASQRLREALNDEPVDALITVTNGPAWRTDLENGDDFSMGSSTLAAVAGHPNLTLPMGLVDGLPVGLSIMSRRGSEHLLIQLAYELERQRDFELEPGFLESLSE